MVRRNTSRSYASQNRKPKIIVLANSKSWSSLIRRKFTQANLCWVLDADALCEEAARQDANAAIVEIPIAKVAGLCIQLSELANNPQDLKLFAVGDAELFHWRKLLRVAGFAFSCWSTLQAKSLEKAVARHLQTAVVRKQTLESSFESNLPWPTAANDTNA